MSSIVALVVIAVAIAIAIALAYLPMRLLLAAIAANVKQFIDRQRERRRIDRDTPDRRKADAPQQP